MDNVKVFYDPTTLEALVFVSDDFLGMFQHDSCIWELCGDCLCANWGYSYSPYDEINWELESMDLITVFKEGLDAEYRVMMYNFESDEDPNLEDLHQLVAVLNSYKIG